MAKYILTIEMEFDNKTKDPPSQTQLVSAVQAAEFWLSGKCLTWGLSGAGK